MRLTGAPRSADKASTKSATSLMSHEPGRHTSSCLSRNERLPHADEWVRADSAAAAVGSNSVVMVVAKAGLDEARLWQIQTSDACVAVFAEAHTVSQHYTPSDT